MAFPSNPWPPWMRVTVDIIWDDFEVCIEYEGLRRFFRAPGTTVRDDLLGMAAQIYAELKTAADVAAKLTEGLE